MADATLTVPLLAVATAAAATTVVLAHRTFRYWRNQLAGRPYELPVDRRGTVLRAAAATVTAAVAASLAVGVLHGGPAPRTTAAARTALAATSAPQPPPPPPPPRTPQPAPPPPEVRTLGHPSGGTLQVLRDGTRVWLPPHYDSRNAARIAYPVVVAHTGDASPPDLFEGFARGARQHKADLFVLVMPPACAPEPGVQGPSADTVLAEVASRYRTLTSVKARGVLGVGPQASCAIREALTSAGRYGAAAGVSGSYPSPPPAPSSAAAAWTGATTAPPLLLATAEGEGGARDSGHALRTVLHARGDSVRVLDGLAPHEQLFTTVAAYFTEKLDGPTRITHPRT